MVVFVIIQNQASIIICPPTKIDFYYGFATGVMLILLIGFYWIALISPQIKKVKAFTSPTKKDGPSPAKMGWSCITGILFLLIIIIGTGVIIWVIGPSILDALTCS